MSIHADICMNRFTLGSDFMYGHIKNDNDQWYGNIFITTTWWQQLC